MGEYDSAVALAKRLITKKGTSVTLRSMTPVAGADPNKPWKRGASSASDQTIEAVFLYYDQNFIDEKLIKMGDQKAYIPSDGLTTDPSVGDLIIRGSEVWKILNCQPLNPGNQKIMFELQVRQGDF